MLIRLLMALTDIHQAWGAHYYDASLSADETGHNQEAQYWDKFYPHPQENEGIRSLDGPFTTSDIWTALRKMKSHRAPGGDGISENRKKPKALKKCSCQFLYIHIPVYGSYKIESRTIYRALKELKWPQRNLKNRCNSFQTEGVGLLCWEHLVWYTGISGPGKW